MSAVETRRGDLRSTEVTLVQAQLRAIDAFNTARRAQELAAQATARTREMRMDARRRLDVLRRQHEALVARTDAALRAEVAPMPLRAERRAVLVHRNEWFCRHVVQVLDDAGVHVLARLDNGAEAVGAVVAEQPDLLLVEDRLPMLPGAEVVREVRRYAPETLVTACACDSVSSELLVEAGAATVFTRQVPPDEVGARLVALVRGEHHAAAGPSG